jgi:5-formyltetrahydrofolate cyclo-ligase
MSTPELKNTIRRQYNEAAKNHAHRPQAVQALVKNLKDVVSRENGTWAAFQPIQYEPPIQSLFESSDDAFEVEWAFPKVEGRDLTFYIPEDREAFELSGWQISEPDTSRSRKVPLNDIRGLLIPGLVFDKAGGRLGRGRGFYDQLLGSFINQNLNPIKVGVAFDWQISASEIPLDAHDVPMDIVVTESAVTECSNRERKYSL